MQSTIFPSPELEGSASRLSRFELPPNASSIPKGPDLSADLSQWVHASLLRMWVEHEIRLLAGANVHPNPLSESPPGSSSESMVCLLCLAYASRRYCSRAIAEACHNDPFFKVICNGQAPAAEELSNFRRQNRWLLAQVLARVFRHAVTNLLNIEPEQLPAQSEQDLWDHALERLELARAMDLDQ